MKEFQYIPQGAPETFWFASDGLNRISPVPVTKQPVGFSVGATRAAYYYAKAMSNADSFFAAASSGARMAWDAECRENLRQAVLL